MRTTSALLLLALAACGTTDAGTDTTDPTGTSSGTDTGTSTDPGTSTGTGTTDDSTGHASHHASEHEHTTAESTSTGHEHPTSTSSGSTTGGGSPAADYCECMLLNCHDQYHGTWGEEHPMSEINCMAAADMLPSVGAPAMSGDSIECRLYHCEAAPGDEALCDAAIGGAPCM